MRSGRSGQRDGYALCCIAGDQSEIEYLVLAKECHHDPRLPKSHTQFLYNLIDSSRIPMLQRLPWNWSYLLIPASSLTWRTCAWTFWLIIGQSNFWKCSHLFSNLCALFDLFQHRPAKGRLFAWQSCTNWPCNFSAACKLTVTSFSIQNLTIHVWIVTYNMLNLNIHIIGIYII